LPVQISGKFVLALKTLIERVKTGPHIAFQGYYLTRSMCIDFCPTGQHDRSMWPVPFEFHLSL